ncbi:MAG: 2Fe-2S iron-sulfur cluster binding domain-containing protein [Alphaproteobacteria bacterium]|nr:2Fe-2S iron-sulfur cluster binding domain-containing protein [Alphaproteobacteria bacterium]
MQIIFICKNGEEKTVTFSPNETVLDVARRNNIELSSNCEGFGVCGSCHIYVKNLLEKLPQKSEEEDNTLDKVKQVRMNSRLACQLVLDESLDGLKIIVV